MMGLALLLRVVFGLGTFVIVAAPITFFVYPWISGLGVLQLVWVVSMVAFIGGNALAGGAGRVRGRSAPCASSMGAQEAETLMEIVVPAGALRR